MLRVEGQAIQGNFVCWVTAADRMQCESGCIYVGLRFLNIAEGWQTGGVARYGGPGRQERTARARADVKE